MFENIAIGWYLILAVFAVAVIVASNKRHKSDPGNPAYGLDDDTGTTVDFDRNILQMSVLGQEKEKAKLQLEEAREYIATMGDDETLFRVRLRYADQTRGFVWSKNVINDNLTQFVEEGAHELVDVVSLKQSNRTQCSPFMLPRAPTTHDTHDENGYSYLIGDVVLVVKPCNTADPEPWIFGGIDDETGGAKWTTHPPVGKKPGFTSMYFKRKHANANKESRKRRT